MSEDKPTETNVVVPDQPGGTTDQAPRARRFGAIWLAVAALTGVAILAGWVWQERERMESARQEWARRLTESEALQREAQAQARQGREGLEALQAKVGALEAQLAESRGQQMALESLYQELARGRDDRLLAEVEHEVVLAAQQLQLAGNVEAALIALQGAEARLAKSTQTQFQPLRKLIARDIERLKALPGADVAGSALKLDALLNGVSTLPLAYRQRPAAAKPASAAPEPTATLAAGLDGWLRRGVAEIWGELRQLVRIERMDRAEPELLAPDEAFFLRENLRLRLLSARLALLARDGRGFHGDLRQANEWIERYFDGKAPAVKEIQTIMKQLDKVDITRVPGDLNETLAALRNFKRVRERGATG